MTPARFYAERGVNGWGLSFGEWVHFRIDQWGRWRSTSWPASYTHDEKIAKAAGALLQSRKLLREYREKSGWSRYGTKHSERRRYLLEFYAERLNQELNT